MVLSITRIVKRIGIAVGALMLALLSFIYFFFFSTFHLGKGEVNADF